MTPNPTYDEQVGATFTQDLNALTFNVTVLAQTDSEGYGPAYTLNGLTAAGYWYQAGISYHWPSSSGTYDPSFAFSYQVYGPSGRSVFPSSGGAGLGSFSKVVHSGDSVLLSLTFVGTTVQMLAQDWDTGATAKASYTSVGSSTFVGNPSRPASSQGFFTGLMTEWYHVSFYSGNEGKVTYTNNAEALTSAWLWVDEFDTSSSGPALFINQTQTPVTFSNDRQFYQFASNGITIYGSAHQFITGLLNTASSRVTLTPAFAETAAPSFVATYTLAGLQQVRDISARAGTVVEADPGTSVTLAINSTSSTPLDRWVFDGSSDTKVVFAAGANATFVYYHLVQETISTQVVSPGAPLPSIPTLSYEVPSPNPVSSPVRVTVTQVLSPTPVIVFALLGSNASISGVIPGVGGERWAASTQSLTVSAPNVLPSPVQFYQQYQVALSYSIIGGGNPPETPDFNSTAFGIGSAIRLSGNSTTGWFDSGSGYSFTSVLNGSTPTERWLYGGGNCIGCAFLGGSFGQTINAPNQEISGDYSHQYHVNLAVNYANGGVISGSFSSVNGAGSVNPGPGWLSAGLNLSLTASANQGWRLEEWNGSGVGAYSGTTPKISVEVVGPFNETATFYVQLAISADAGTNVAYAYGAESGTVQAGSNKSLYVPPTSSVTLKAAPSAFVYSFASWHGTGLANSTKPSLKLLVDSPAAVTGTSSYSTVVILGGLATAAIVLVLAGSLWIRSRRNRVDLRGFVPGAILK